MPTEADEEVVGRGRIILEKNMGALLGSHERMKESEIWQFAHVRQQLNCSGEMDCEQCGCDVRVCVVGSSRHPTRAFTARARCNPEDKKQSHNHPRLARSLHL